MGKRRSKRGKRQLPDPEVEDQKKIPKSFIFKSGLVGQTVSLLIRDMRKVMSPNTAKRLKERRSNKIKDFLQVAAQFKVTHFMMFTQTEVGTYLKAARVPRGPTLTFRVLNYTLCADLIKTARRNMSLVDLNLAPTIVLNNFGEDQQSIRLAASMFQNMFPAIDVLNTQVFDLRRVVLFNYNAETETIDFRHYRIDVKETGISKGIKSILRSNLPDLGDLKDISEFVVTNALGQESDADEAFEQTVDVTAKSSRRGKKTTSTRAVKLVEIGPRMELQLVKIQAGLCDGEVLYHRFIEMTKEENEQQKRAFDQKKAEIQKRKLQQELNVQKKKEAAERHRIACGAQPKASTLEDADHDEKDEAAGDEATMEADDFDGIGGFDINEEDLFEEQSDFEDEDSDSGVDSSAQGDANSEAEVEDSLALSKKRKNHNR